jgi:malonyl-CoA O-methyltransferase
MMAQRLVAQAFGRADDYDAHAGVQQQVAAMLAQAIGEAGCAPDPRVLEIGCGTGLLGAALMPLLPGADWLMSDLSPAMLERARARFAGEGGIAYRAMDGQAPDVTGPFDLIASSLAFQWFDDLGAALARLDGLLARGGLLAFTTMIAGSFDEWRAAHEGLPCGLADYPSGADLQAMGFAVREVSLTVDGGGRAFLRHLRGIGADVARDGHRPLSAGQLRQVMARFDSQGGRATYRVALCLRRDGA